MSEGRSLFGATAGGGRRFLGVALAAALALAVALALATPARGATQTFPVNGGFNANANGWSQSESCDGLLSALVCTTDNAHVPGDGQPPGSIEFSASTLLDVGLLDAEFGQAIDNTIGGVLQTAGLDGLLASLLGGLGGGELLGLEEVIGGLGIDLGVGGLLDVGGLTALLSDLSVEQTLGLTGLLGQLGIPELPVSPRSTWTSPNFTYTGGAPVAIGFAYDRRAMIGPLVNLGGSARSTVVLVNLNTGGERTILNETFTNSNWQNRTVGVPANAVTPGATYRLELRSSFGSFVGVLAESRVRYDNVRISVNDGIPGGPGGPGGGGQGTGAGGLGACEADLSRPAVAGRGGGDPSAVALSRQQLLINQRISQAGVRRVNSAIDKLTGGLSTEDFRDCSIGASDFNAGLLQAIENDQPADPPTGVQPPRETPARPSGGGDPNAVTLSRQQLLINQRISQAAVRRVNAVRERLDGNVTAGDLRQGVISAMKLDTSGRFTFDGALPAGANVAQSFQPLDIIVKRAPTPERVTLTRQQLLINQRISQAAVRRVNQVRTELAVGLTGRNIMDGSLGRANLTPQVQAGE